MSENSLWSIREAAEHLGLQRKAASRQLSRWGVKAVRYEPGPSGRVEARFDPEQVKTAAANRPGRGHRSDLPGRAPRTVTYLGGPLDGQEMDVTGWTDEAVRGGVYQIVDGWEDRAGYSPDPGGDPLIWKYRGPVPG